MKKIIFLLCCSLSLCAQDIIDEKVIICGVCKNVARPLPRTMHIMEQIGSLFKDYRIVVYENNSTDSTSSILKKWMRKNNKVFAKSEMLDLNSIPFINHRKNGQLFHVEQIALARNKVLDMVMSETYKDFTYLIWMDMDFVKQPSLQGITETFQTDQEWDAVFAYGVSSVGDHWDWYAFRDAKYNPLGPELLGDAWWKMPDHRLFSLDQSSDWYPVTSAFNGCGIYKKSSIEGCRYAAIITEDLETVANTVITQGLESNLPQVLTYLNNISTLTVIEIDQPIPNLPKIYDPSNGFVLTKSQDPLVWRLNSEACQYPSVCEHVPFHASMIVRGHDKLFINPRIIFTYCDKLD